MLKTYFRSGWAFFIPYLAAYLLYAWLRWPVNPVTGDTPPATESVHPSPFSLLLPPSLLHVYWVLHAVHLVLGAFALRAWWQAGSKEQGAKSEEQLGQSASSLTSLESGGLPAADRLQTTGCSLLPWLGFALAFWLPGLYLEWPSDTWEHLHRITSWATHEVAGDHAAGYKSLYFLPYSLIGGAGHAGALIVLNFYSTVLCLLLGWQYHRLGLAVGLSTRVSFLFALLTTLTMGSSCFAFPRYYCLSTSVISQLGAVALTRHLIVLASGGEITAERMFRALPACGLLAIVVATNHVQGIGIAILNLSSIAAWRVCDARRPLRWLVVVTFLLANLITFLVLPRQAILAEWSQSAGWLNPFGGFNLYDWRSPAFARALAIIGGMGAVSLLAATPLLARNHLIGWLTWGPVFWLSLPLYSLPFANLLARSGPEQIVTFHRMFLALPVGMGLLAWLDLGSQARILRLRFAPSVPWLFCLLLLCAVVASGPGHPIYNRFWNAMAVSPDDLEMRAIHRMAPAIQPEKGESLALPVFESVLRAISPGHTGSMNRPLGQPMAAAAEHIIRKIESRKPVVGGQFEELIDDPLMKSPASWMTYSGTAATFVAGIAGPAQTHTAVQNPAGQTSEILTFRAIPLDADASYQVEISLRQSTGELGLTLPAVAWFDEEGKLLPSFLSEPAGWVNGTFSYFGRFASAKPSGWTTYRVSFGPGETRAVPQGARAFRVGALLNTEQSAGVVVQMTNVRAWIKRPAARLIDGVYVEGHPYHVMVPDWRWLHSPYSHAAALSEHWLPNQAASDLVGGSEIRRAVAQAQRSTNGP